MKSPEFLTILVYCTGHIYMYGLMEEQPYARHMQEEAIREIEATSPRYVVVANGPQSWLMKEGSDRLILDWSQRYLAEAYQLVEEPYRKVVEIRSRRKESVPFQ